VSKKNRQKLYRLLVFVVAYKYDKLHSRISLHKKHDCIK